MQSDFFQLSFSVPAIREVFLGYIRLASPVFRKIENVPVKTTDWNIRMKRKRSDLSIPDQYLEKREYQAVPGIFSDRWIYKRILRMM